MKSKAYTTEEARTKFLEHIKDIKNFWLNVEGRSESEKMYGLVFSILVLFDGGSGMMPAFDIVPAPDPTDKQYCIDNGEKYFEKEVINDCQLHEIWSRMRKN